MSYIDLHAHVLPGVDDGAETLEASLMMLRMASEHGTKALAVTPHGAGVTKTQYLGKFDRLQSGDVQPLGESRFLLVEFDPFDSPEWCAAATEHIRNTGMCRSSHTRSGTSFCKTNLGARSCGQSGGLRCR